MKTTERSATDKSRDSPGERKDHGSPEKMPTTRNGFNAVRFCDRVCPSLGELLNLPENPMTLLLLEHPDTLEGKLLELEGDLTFLQIFDYKRNHPEYRTWTFIETRYI